MQIGYLIWGMLSLVIAFVFAICIFIADPAKISIFNAFKVSSIFLGINAIIFFRFYIKKEKK